MVPRLLLRVILARLAMIGLALTVGGCGWRDTEFRLNRVYLKKQEVSSRMTLSKQQEQDLADLLTLLFGTPDTPRLPDLQDVDMNRVLSLERLRVAAGPVGSDQQGRPRGLYREHCAHCHGITGDGAGPMAVFLQPYPRDFRRGIFKYKSTAGPLTPPTHQDLVRLVRNGNPGTAMPSFRLLDDEEIDALVDYVRYLAIRGEIERALIFESFDRLENEYDRLVDLSLQETRPDEFAEQMAEIRGLVADVAQRWLEAPVKVTPVPLKPKDWDLAASIRRGRELFTGDIANCAKCHGSQGLGDGQTTDFDDWTKEIVDPQNPHAADQYVAVGALTPQTIFPRNFHRGMFRGGSQPNDLYVRIHNGIAGTPMPAAPLRPDGAAPDDVRLSSDDIWHLVDYVLSLSRSNERVAQTGQAVASERR